METAHLTDQHQRLNKETFEGVSGLLGDMFDIEGFTQALRSPQASPVSLAAFERRLAYPRMPVEFSPTFYERPKTPGGGVSETPLESLVFDTGEERVQVLDKREDMQPHVFNYKGRGARHAILRVLNGKARKQIMTTASAGNHALSTALVTASLNHILPNSLRLQAEVHCRRAISAAKLAALQQYSNVILKPHYETLEDAFMGAEQAVAANTFRAMVHPFDDENTIVGPTTMALEYVAQLKNAGVDLQRRVLRLRVGMGGGGLAAGSLIAWDILKAQGVIHPDSEIIGVESEWNDSINREITGRPPLTAETINTSADGIATLRGGRKTVSVIAHRISGIEVVSNDHLALACGTLASAHDGKAPELAGALSLAALIQHREAAPGHPDSDILELTVTSGANIATELLLELGKQYADHPELRYRMAAVALKAAGLRGNKTSTATYNTENRRNPGIGSLAKPAQAGRVLNVWKGAVTR